MNAERPFTFIRMGVTMQPGLRSGLHFSTRTHQEYEMGTHVDGGCVAGRTISRMNSVTRRPVESNFLDIDSPSCSVKPVAGGG